MDVAEVHNVPLSIEGAVTGNNESDTNVMLSSTELEAEIDETLKYEAAISRQECTLERECNLTEELLAQARHAHQEKADCRKS